MPSAVVRIGVLVWSGWGIERVPTYFMCLWGNILFLFMTAILVVLLGFVCR